MTPDEIRTAVRQAIAELMAAPPRRALVLFTGGLLGFADALEGLGLLADEGVALDVVQTPSAQRVLDQGRIAELGFPLVSHGLVSDHQMLIAPTLTANIAAKVAHGVADCVASNLFSEFIMSGRQVVASSTPVSPDSAAKRSWFPNMPPAYAQLQRENLAALESFGVRLATSGSLARTALAAFDRADCEHRHWLEGLGLRIPKDLTQQEPAVRAEHAVLEARPHGGGVRHVSTHHEPDRSSLHIPERGAEVPTECAARLISQGIVQQSKPGSCLRIRADALVTAAARDLAAQRGIAIKVVS